MFELRSFEEGNAEAVWRLYESAGYSETGRRDTGRFVFVDFAKQLLI